MTLTVKKTVLIMAPLVLLSSLVSGQPYSGPPPVSPIGLDGTIDKFYGRVHQALVATADGKRHLVHLTSKTTVHDGHGDESAGLGSLEPGSHIVVHYVLAGGKKEALEIDRIDDHGLGTASGTAVDVDRRDKRLLIRLDNGSLLKLRLTDHAASDSGLDVAAKHRVIVYYADESGEPVAHYFRRVK